MIKGREVGSEKENKEKEKNDRSVLVKIPLKALFTKKLRINSFGRSFGLFSLLMCILQPKLAEVLKFNIKTN